MDWTLIASTIKGVGDGSLGPTIDLDTSGADLIVLAGLYTSFVIGTNNPTFTDTFNNSVGSPIVKALEVNNATAALWSLSNPTVGSGHHFNMSATGLGGVLGVLAFSSGGSTGQPDTFNGAHTGGVNSLQPGSITPSASNELFVSALCIGAFTTGGYNQTETSSIDSSFIKQGQIVSDGVNFLNGSIAYKFQAGLSSENPTWSWTSSAVPAAVQACFKVVGAAGGTPAALPFQTVVDARRW